MSTATQLWDTASFLTRSETEPSTALVILNTPLPPQSLFRRMWKTARVRYCADGGANRLYDRFVKGKGKLDSDDAWTDDDANELNWLPDLVLGDLDSLRDDVREYYEQKGVEVRRDRDEFSTDLGKNVAELARFEQTQPAPLQLVIVGGLSGRLDQTIHTLHALVQLVEKEKRERVWAIGKESAACILPKGKHHLRIDLESFGKTCGILPLGSAEAYVTTSGLEWDLGPTSYMYPTSFAEAVSTSNHLVQPDVTIETDVNIVWTMEIRGGAD
ncbi:thiamine diphosphokinase [Sporobolomyces koalae]|uniref:thiamine diphosphokinase n=1 Tax=Sporobolomyces koalae TaxID=500713 RepID=UPI00317EC2BB